MKIKLEHDEPLAIGPYAEATGSGAVAIGDYAIAQQGSIQLGAGTNIDPNTLKFKNTTLVNANGKVPTANLDKTVVLRTNGVAPDAEGNVKVSQLISSNGDGKASIDNNGNLNLVGEYTSGRIVIEVPEGEEFKFYPHTGHSGVLLTGKTYIDDTKHPWDRRIFQSVGRIASSPSSGSLCLLSDPDGHYGNVMYHYTDYNVFDLSGVDSWNPSMLIYAEYCGTVPSVYREKVFLPPKRVDTVHDETHLKSPDGYMSILASNYPNGATVKQPTGKSYTVKIPAGFKIYRTTTSNNPVYQNDTGSAITIKFKGPYEYSPEGAEIYYFWIPIDSPTVEDALDGWFLQGDMNFPEFLMFSGTETFYISDRYSDSPKLSPGFSTFEGYTDGDFPTITAVETETKYIATSKIKLRDPYIVTSQRDMNRLFISDIAGGSGVQFSAMSGTSYDTIELQGNTIKLVGHSGSTPVEANIGEHGFSADWFDLYQTPQGGTTPPTIRMHKFGDALGTHTMDRSFTLAVSSGVVKDSAGGSGYVVYAIPS